MRRQRRGAQQLAHAVAPARALLGDDAEVHEVLPQPDVQAGETQRTAGGLRQPARFFDEVAQALQLRAIEPERCAAVEQQVFVPRPERE